MPVIQLIWTSKHHTFFHGHQVYSLEELLKLNPDMIIIAAAYIGKEIYNAIKSYAKNVQLELV